MITSIEAARLNPNKENPTAKIFSWCLRLGGLGYGLDTLQLLGLPLHKILAIITEIEPLIEAKNKRK